MLHLLTYINKRTWWCERDDGDEQIQSLDNEISRCRWNSLLL